MNHAVRIKICGITREEDLHHAVSLGVNALGLIFYSGSPRGLSILQAKKILEKIPVFVDIVAVLVNPEISFVKELLEQLPLHYLQFHGQESAQFCQQFNKPYIKAISATSMTDIQTASLTYLKASAILLDTPTPQGSGGAGKPFDWQLIPKQLSQPLILAGGLNDSNVKTAIKSCQPYAVDVSSAVEIYPGIKDHSKMTRFVNSVWGNHD